MVTRKPSPGAQAFARFLKARDLSDARAGALLGVTGVTIYHWRIGAKLPVDLSRRKIEIFTRSFDPATGAIGEGILPSAWDVGGEVAALETVVPFDVPSKSATAKGGPLRRATPKAAQGERSPRRSAAAPLGKAAGA